MSKRAPKRTQMNPGAPECTPTHQKAPPPSVRTQNPRSECTDMHPGAPECTLKNRAGENKPAAPAPAPAPALAPLSLAQHAAIRHLARGCRVGHIARHLGVSRHTIRRWKHDPRFVAELERLRVEMTRAIIDPAAKTAAARDLDPLAAYARAASLQDDDEADDFDDDEDGEDGEDGEAEEEMSDEEFAQTEAWVEQIVAAARAGREIPPPPPLKENL